MDFAHGDAALEASRLAGQILGAAGRDGTGRQGAGRQGAGREGAGREGAGREAAPPDFDPGTWKELAQAGLLSLAVPAALGGEGLGVAETAAVLTQAGRHAARVPALATLALGVLPVARSAGEDVQRALLAGVASGETIITAAVREPSDPMPAAPATAVSSSAGFAAVSGVKVGVPYAGAARWILVPASLPGGGSVVAVVEPDADGLCCQRTRSSSGMPEYTLRFDRVPVRYTLAGGAAGELYRLAVAGACCVADGALAAALELTTQHVRTREQFGKPLATFQAVAQQIADVYIAARTLHLATVSACWRLDAGRDADEDVDVAGYWLAEHGQAALRTCHHLHGGLGMDVSYPLPRYSALVTDLVGFVGGASYRLDRLGERTAADSHVH
jgi:3-oxo-4-pregnene-20-carboxyl-CoA dehydrogenase alpha subunit